MVSSMCMRSYKSIGTTVDEMLHWLEIREADIWFRFYVPILSWWPPCVHLFEKSFTFGVGHSSPVIMRLSKGSA